MELDVHLTRDGDEAWGFEFVGGADCNEPLTIYKVLPSSPALAAGLQAGDVVARLGDRLATELTLGDALAIVADSVASLSFGICRGLYDPVLEDFEPIYEPTDRADSDLRSEPTEVYQDLSLDDPNILDPSITDPSLWDSGYTTRPLTETRSLTASPFVPNTKPYRPFSTEPLEVPPLDDPIILNPNYKDSFNLNGSVKPLEPEEDDLLRLLPLDRDVEAKFKLPVSEKYDPDWDKKIRALLEKCAEGESDSQQIERELTCYSNQSQTSADAIAIKEVLKATEELTVNEKKTMKRVKVDEMKEEFSAQKLEQVALEVVEQSIERAVSVTEDIQKEIEEERNSISREIVDETEKMSEMKTHVEKIETKQERKESVCKHEIIESVQDNVEESNFVEERRSLNKKNIVQETKEESSKSESKFEMKESVQHESDELEESKEISKINATESEYIQNKLKQDEKFVEERRLTNKKEMEEAIETGNVRRKSSVFQKQDISDKVKNDIIDESISSGTVKRQSMFEKDDKQTSKEILRNTAHTEEIKSKHASELKSSGKINAETLKSEGKQKAYMIGLQTIPHIKGFVQSSYHFDLLLRTFFVHLTDVMVALSRFILTQPTQELERKAEQVVKEELIKDFAEKDSRFDRSQTKYKREEIKDNLQSVKERKFQENDIRKEAKVVEAKQEIKTAKVQKEYKKEAPEVKQVEHNIMKSEHVQQAVKKQEHIEVGSEEMETRKKSGVEMAQRTQKKSRDLTQKMDAVITEFESKTGIEDRLEVTEQRSRRSRSRSQVEEEVMRESDPLEWLDKVDSRRASQERTSITMEKGLSSYSESKESKRSESKRESRTTKVKPGKQMYVAIVESHVYTNVDAILEDQVAEMSETASVQSSEEINAALESSEAISTENVAISNIVQSEEKQQAVEVITNALQEIVQEKQEVLETTNDFKLHIAEQHSKTVIQESHASVAAESTEIISESKVEEFKASELKEIKATAVEEENYKTAAVEFIDEPIEATKEVLVETKSTKQEAVSKQELLTSVAAETMEIIDESKLESFKATEIISKQVTISSEENYKAAAESTSEMILEASKEETAEFKVKEHQAVSKVESLAIAVAESTDVVTDDSKAETFESQELTSKKALVKSEETYKTAAVGVAEVTFETAEDKHSDQTKTCEVTVKEEAQHLAVAGIIETKTELCKEPKKTSEDEYASLKIVKEVTIDGGESISISSESELNVSKSLEVDISSSHHLSMSQSNYQSISQESSLLEQEMSSSVQASSISMQESHKSAKSLHIDTSIAQSFGTQISELSDENNNTPTPSTVPPTPLTDEYVFKLEIPLPKNQGTVIVEDSPDREDPHIVKKGLVPHIETTIEDQIIYDPPLPTPPEDKVQSPVYTKPGLKGGEMPLFKRVCKPEYIREIERKSSLLASAIDETIKSIEEYKEEVGIDTNDVTIPLPRKTKRVEEPVTNGVTNGHEENGIDNERRKEKTENNQEKSKEMAATDADRAGGDVLPGFKPVVFNPDAFQAKLYEEVIRGTEPAPVEVKPYVDESGAPLGTVQGIVDGLDDATVDEELAKELGKPGLTENKIAELISGESEMLREAHVMGLSRVLTSHMTRPDDSSVDFHKIKPLYDSLKDSEVLKALNDDLKRECEEKKKKEEKKWTTFLQKPKRPVPRGKLGCNRYVEIEEDFNNKEDGYKVKIVKQPKPKVAPDYKPEDFDTGPLPWEQRALTEPVPSPVPPEEPILIPEEAEFFEAVDPLPESEVPDLEDTGLPLPPTPPPALPEVPPLPEPSPTPELPDTAPEDLETPTETPQATDMDQNAMAEQLVNTVKGMVDPQAPLEQQLCQMRAQLAALAQLPCVIQQSLELLTRQLATMTRQETHHASAQMTVESRENTATSIQEYEERTQNTQEQQNYREVTQNGEEVTQNGQEEPQRENMVTIEEIQDTMTSEEKAGLQLEQDRMIEEQRKSEKEKKEQQEKIRLDQESRQVKQRAPRVGKPRPAFGPLTPEERPLVLPGGRRWRGPKDAYNDQFIAETIQAQSEIIQGKVMGYESDRLPYDDRINFMKYEKPPVSLDHLQHSATYKLVHNLEEAPLKRTDLLTPVVAEADYRERCRSQTPNMAANGRM